MTFAEIASIAAVLVSAYSIWSQRRFVNAQTDEKMSETRKIEYDVTERVLKTAQEELTRHHKEIERLSAKVEELTRLIDSVEDELETERKARIAAELRVERYVIGIKKLIDQLVRNGHVPDWQPETGPLAPTKPTP